MSEQTHGNHGLSFKNPAASVLHGYLNRSPVPSSGSISAARRIIHDTYQGLAGSKDSIGVCLNLIPRVTDSTLVLAEMFGSGDAGLPEHWKNNPEAMRSVLSMNAYVELGVLQARRVHYLGQGEEGVSSFDEKISSLERLTRELQAREEV